MDDIPKEVLIDCAHLVKANSIQGNTDSREISVRCLRRVFLVHTSMWFFGSNTGDISAVVLSVKPVPAGLTGSRCRLQLLGLPVTLL